MKSSNIISSSIRAIDNTLQDTLIGDVINSLVESGCSLCFITSSISSMIIGYKNRKRANEDTIADIEFREELERQKEHYDISKENKEIELKLRLKLLQRQHHREQNCLTLQNEQTIEELKMFFSGWPLATSINGLLKNIQESSMFKPELNVVIGRVQSEYSNDPIVNNYKDPKGGSKGITNIVIDTLNSIGFDKKRVHLIKDESQLFGGALFANIFAVMHSIPTVVISPIIYDNKMHINIACWNQDSPFPFQEEVFVTDYNSQKAKIEQGYLNQKNNEFIQMIVAIASVFNETYLLSEGRLNDSGHNFPQYANDNRISIEYPFIIDFALKEYYSLITNPQDELFKECDSALSFTPIVNEQYFTNLKQQIDSLVEPIKK